MSQATKLSFRFGTIRSAKSMVVAGRGQQGPGLRGGAADAISAPGFPRVTNPS